MSVVVETYETGEPLVGRSHWWGAPDLPEGVPYPYIELEDGTPEPLTFVFQLRLEDIAGLDEAKLLPHKGMLYFFAPLDYFLGDYDSPLDYHTPPVVLYCKDLPAGLSPYELCWEDSGESVFRPALGISLRKADDAPHYGNVLLATPLQEEMSENHPGEICLLQIDENEDWGLRFYDCGSYYMFISPEALKNCDFSRIDGDLFFY